MDRNIYPEAEYPYGQWSYQKFYETDFEKASAWFDENIPAFLRVSRTKGDPKSLGKPAPLANVSESGGWMNGAKELDPKLAQLPLEYTVYESEDFYNEFVAAMSKTGFWPGDAWYSNHARNREYILKNRKNEGNLEVPVLFVRLTNPTLSNIC